MYNQESFREEIRRSLPQDFWTAWFAMPDDAEAHFEIYTDLNLAPDDALEHLYQMQDTAWNFSDMKMLRVVQWTYWILLQHPAYAMFLLGNPRFSSDIAEQHFHGIECLIMESHRREVREWDRSKGSLKKAIQWRPLLVPVFVLRAWESYLGSSVIAEGSASVWFRFNMPNPKSQAISLAEAAAYVKGELSRERDVPSLSNEEICKRLEVPYLVPLLAGGTHAQTQD